MSHTDHTIESWSRAKVILASALELDNAEREQFVANLDIDDALRVEIESLLNLSSDCEEFLSEPAIGFADELIDDLQQDGGSYAGVRLGPYEIVGELGTGGMGSVFLGERRDGKFDRKVAIKILRREFDTASIRRNFQREKEILAALAHPSIAGLLDADQTDEGIPYLVMEYVDGVPIDKFCFNNQLDLTNRLKLFNKICDAVSFAHRKLIVHLDLKPSNILVTNEGVPKLLDFGISKILDDEPGGTQTTLHRAMTPEYASPEQINGTVVTTATDVYSLGIVLCKMLTGVHPFKQKERGNGLLKAITEDEPTAPSSLCSQNREATLSGSEFGDRADRDRHGSISPSQLKGDLDNIILKSIRKDPERRYASVDMLSADIWRFLDGKPVEARKATLGYRFRKYYRRNRVAVAAGALLAITLIAGTVVSTWQTGVARANAAAAVKESENARAEQQKAEQVSKFMISFIRYANPNWYAEGYRFAGEARVIDALDDMASKIDTELAAQPDVLAEVHHQFGAAYLSSAGSERIEQARHHFRRAFEVRRAHYGDWHELLAKDMVYLYWSQPSPHKESDVQMLSNAIIMLRATNQMNLNLPYMLEDYIVHLFLPRHANMHDMYLRNAPQPVPDNKYLAAEQLYEEMMGLLRRHFAEDSPQIDQQKCQGMLLKKLAGRQSEAEELYRSCLTAVEKAASAGKPNAKWQEMLSYYENAVPR